MKIKNYNTLVDNDFALTIYVDMLPMICQKQQLSDLTDLIARINNITLSQNPLFKNLNINSERIINR